jgi:hypothetical protein
LATFESVPQLWQPGGLHGKRDQTMKARAAAGNADDRFSISQTSASRGAFQPKTASTSSTTASLDGAAAMGYNQSSPTAWTRMLIRSNRGFT